MEGAGRGKLCGNTEGSQSHCRATNRGLLKGKQPQSQQTQAHTDGATLRPFQCAWHPLKAGMRPKIIKTRGKNLTESRCCVPAAMTDCHTDCLYECHPTEALPLVRAPLLLARARQRELLPPPPTFLPFHVGTRPTRRRPAAHSLPPAPALANSNDSLPPSNPLSPAPPAPANLAQGSSAAHASHGTCSLPHACTPPPLPRKLPCDNLEITSSTYDLC